MVKKEKGMGHARHRYMMGRQDPVSGASRDPTQQAGKTRWASRDPHPLGRQPGHQGAWALVKETPHTQGKQPVH